MQIGSEDASGFEQGKGRVMVESALHPYRAEQGSSDMPSRFLSAFEPMRSSGYSLLLSASRVSIVSVDVTRQMSREWPDHQGFHSYYCPSILNENHQ